MKRRTPEPSQRTFLHVHIDDGELAWEIARVTSTQAPSHTHQESVHASHTCNVFADDRRQKAKGNGSQDKTQMLHGHGECRATALANKKVQARGGSTELRRDCSGCKSSPEPLQQSQGMREFSHRCCLGNDTWSRGGREHENISNAQSRQCCLSALWRKAPNAPSTIRLHAHTAQDQWETEGRTDVSRHPKACCSAFQMRWSSSICR